MRLGNASAMAIPSHAMLEMLKQSIAHAGTESSRKKKRKEKQEVKAVDEDLDMFSDWCVCCKPEDWKWNGEWIGNGMVNGLEMEW